MRSLLFIMLLLTASAASAQEPAAVNVFLDCQASDCDADHFRNEIRWVNWVRERTAADVHLLITSESAGGGGRVYQLAFIGQREYEGDDAELRVDAGSNLTGAERRDRLTLRIAQGLLRYAARGPAADALRIVYEGDDVADAVTAAADPWRNWVFSTSLAVSLDGEAREGSHELELAFDATRVTVDTRLEFEIDVSYEEDRFQLSTGEQRFITRNWEMEALATRALAARWSAGFSVETGRSTFQNQDFYVRPATVLEYSFYPYDEFSRRRVTLQYSLGGRHAEYAELTIYDRLRERRFDHRLELAADFQQPWGSAWSRLGGSHYLHDVGRYRVTSRAGVFVRLFRGFTLDVRGAYSRVHDQLYIPAGDAGDEEVLLRRRALETNYEYSTSIGIRYSFGSLFNNVVNPRVGG